MDTIIHNLKTEYKELESKFFALEAKWNQYHNALETATLPDARLWLRAQIVLAELTARDYIRRGWEIIDTLNSLDIAA